MKKKYTCYVCTFSLYIVKILILWYYIEQILQLGVTALINNLKVGCYEFK